MATYRPQKRIDGDSRMYTVASGQTVRAGMGLKLAATDTAPANSNYPQVQEAAADTDVIESIAYSDDPAKTWAAGELVEGIFLQGEVTIPVLVGTGDMTRGLQVVAVSDGFTDAPAHGTGSRIYSPGVAVETGTVGQWASINVQKVALSKA